METEMSTTKTNLAQWIGRPIEDLPTPALLVDRDRLQSNLTTMQSLVSAHGKALRPHIKTHKCSMLARLQVQAGAIGVTCATMGEAETMAEAGIQDILIANQLVTADKLARAARLAQRCQLKFAVDSDYGIQAAQTAADTAGLVFDVLVEVDSGGRRCGAQTPEEAARLVERILSCRSLRFAGIQAYNGGTSYLADLDQRRQAVAASDRVLAGVLERVRQVAAVERVSGAGAGNARYHLENGLLSEIQAGSYVYSDTTYRDLAPEYQPALTVLAAVISRSLPGYVILDAGLKGVGSEFSSPELLDYPGLRFDHYSEEHSQWEAGDQPAPTIGEKVRIIPSHSCTTANLHRRCFVLRGQEVVDAWAIDAF
jgi:D-serine deaminase-like pyridoxal phosphate-dependent protein